jgi:hypothetical protein
MFATHNPSEAVAAGEPPAAEDTYGPSPINSSTRSTKQIDLWMDVVRIRGDSVLYRTVRMRHTTR